MFKWLKANVYIAAWIGAAYAVIAVHPAIERIVKNVRAMLCLSAAAIFIAAYPKIKRIAKNVCVTFAAWLMVSSALMLMRLTMSQEAMKDLVKSLLILACVYVVFRSTQNGIKVNNSER